MNNVSSPQSSQKKNPHSAWEITRWIAGTSPSRLVASWLTLGLFIYLTSWSVWTLLCLIDLVQLSLRGEKLALRAALLLLEGTAHTVAWITPSSASERAQVFAANLASTRQRLRSSPADTK